MPAARASSTPSTDAPVLYIHCSPGWASRGSEPSPAIHSSGPGCLARSGQPRVASRRSLSAAMTGHGCAAVNISWANPNPKVKVSRSRTVISRRAGTVSSSGPSIRRSTRRLASSGSSRPTGSSRLSRPSATRASVAAPVMGLVTEAIRNSESRWTGRSAPAVSVPSATAWTSPPRAASATSPGMRSSATCGSAAARSACPVSISGPPGSRPAGPCWPAQCSRRRRPPELTARGGPPAGCRPAPPAPYS